MQLNFDLSYLYQFAMNGLIEHIADVEGNDAKDSLRILLKKFTKTFTPNHEKTGPVRAMDIRNTLSSWYFKETGDIVDFRFKNEDFNRKDSLVYGFFSLEYSKIGKLEVCESEFYTSLIDFKERFTLFASIDLSYCMDTTIVNRWLDIDNLSESLLFYLDSIIIEHPRRYNKYIRKELSYCNYPPIPDAQVNSYFHIRPFIEGIKIWIDNPLGYPLRFHCEIFNTYPEVKIKLNGLNEHEIYVLGVSEPYSCKRNQPLPRILEKHRESFRLTYDFENSTYWRPLHEFR